MALDFDPFSQLDMNFDNIVDESDLKVYELQQGHGIGLEDLSHDLIMDQFQSDLNQDFLIDNFQLDINHNSIIDKYESHYFGASFQYDINGDGKVDHLDRALAMELFPKD